MSRRQPRPAPDVHVLDVDHDLADALDQRVLAEARMHARARTVVLESGSWDVRPLFEGGAGLLGLLVVDGLMIRRVLVAGQHCGELVATGALLRPWEHLGEQAPMPFDVVWEVIDPLRLALLDDRTLTTIAHWPRLLDALVARATERSHELAFSLAVHSLRRVDVRVLVLLWHLADRFGKVTPAGIVVPLPLTHAHIAELVGAARPTVSTAVGQLEHRGCVARCSDRRWLLVGDPPPELTGLRDSSATIDDGLGARTATAIRHL